jgi:hypothetical protein
MSLNTGGNWIQERFEVGGYGQRFGTSPEGGRASGYHLGSVPYASAPLPAGIPSAWTAIVLSGAVWVVDP